MKLRDIVTRRNIILASALLTTGIAVALYFALRRPPEVAMVRYVPASALAYLEVNNLSDVVDGLTGTKAWHELAPVLGLSSQIRQLGFISDLVGRTGFGPDEAVVAGRAQFALALTGIETETGESDDGPYVHFKLRAALVIETHTTPETAARIVRERASIIAQRIYGTSVAEEDQEYEGTRLLIFRGSNSDRQLVAASSGTAVLLANHIEALKSCLDATAGRASTLGEDATLKTMRPEVDQDSSVFAYVTESGIEKLVALGPALIASRFSSDQEGANSAAALFEHLSKQTAAGLLYGAEFDSNGVIDRYLTVLRPGVAEGLAEPLKSASGASFPSLQSVPRDIKELTILNVDRVGELPERILKSLAPHVDLVAGVALRELVIGFRKQHGIESSDSLGDAIGNEVAIVNLGDAKPVVEILRVKDKTKLATVVERYLSLDGAHVTTEAYNDTEIRLSSHEDGRAAAFTESYLILGTRDQIARVLDAQSSGNSIASDDRLKQAMSSRTAKTSIITCKPEVKDAGELMLAISKLTRVTDGSRDLLEQDSMRKALDRLPLSASFTEFRSYGVYVESRSAVGNFGMITALIGSDEDVQPVGESVSGRTRVAVFESGATRPREFPGRPYKAFGLMQLKTVLENRTRNIKREKRLLPSAFSLESFSRKPCGCGFAAAAAEYAYPSALAHLYAVAHLAVEFHEVVVH
jgi:hypothetical protein